MIASPLTTDPGSPLALAAPLRGVLTMYGLPLLLPSLFVPNAGAFWVPVVVRLRLGTSITGIRPLPVMLVWIASELMSIAAATY